MAADTVGFHAHDHSACIADAIGMAEQTSHEKGLKFTPVRRRVLELLLESHVAMGAYDVLERLAQEGMGDKPPVAYRALAFLVDNGLAHRIEKLNAYVACTHPGAAHDPAFMICRNCHLVAETEPAEPLGKSAGEAGFQIEHMVIEAEGLCPKCQSKPNTGAKS